MEAITLVLEEDRALAVALGLDDRLFCVWERGRRGACIMSMHMPTRPCLSFIMLHMHIQDLLSLIPQSLRSLTNENTHCTSPLFPSCSRVCQPLVVWEVGFPGGTAQVAVMSLERSASRTICPGFCPYFIYVMVHLVNTTLPATHLLITTCWHSFNLFL